MICTGNICRSPMAEVVLRANGHVLDRLKVGPRCPEEPPHSGLPRPVVPKVVVPKAP